MLELNKELLDRAILFIRLHKKALDICLANSSTPYNKTQIELPGSLGQSGLHLEVPNTIVGKFPREVWGQAYHDYLIECLHRSAEGHDED